MALHGIGGIPGGVLDVGGVHQSAVEDNQREEYEEPEHERFNSRARAGCDRHRVCLLSHRSVSLMPCATVLLAEPQVHEVLAAHRKGLAGPPDERAAADGVAAEDRGPG